MTALGQRALSRGTMGEVSPLGRLDLRTATQGRPLDCSTSSSNPMIEGPWCRFRREARARERHRHCSGGWSHRIDVHNDRLAVRLRSRENPGTTKLADGIRPSGDHFLSIPWQMPPSKRFRQILLPHGVSRKEVRPERPERRLRLVRAIARGRRWLDEIVSSSVTDAEQIALRERCSVRQFNMTISLAFLAPKLVRAAVEGRLPRANLPS